MAGEGAAAPGGGARGDLYLQRHGDARTRASSARATTCTLTLPVTAPDAALGTEIDVPTLKGKVSMKIPPETSSGRTFRLPGYGMPHLKGGGAGDQYVSGADRRCQPGSAPSEKELYES